MHHCKNLGIRLLPYLNDFLFMSTSREAALQLSFRILRDFREAGFVVNMEKSLLHPSQSIIHLGMMVNSVTGQFEVPSRRWEKLQAAIKALCSAHRNRVPVRLLASCVGLIISMKVALGPVVHRYTRFLYEVINQVPRWSCWVTLP